MSPDIPIIEACVAGESDRFGELYDSYAQKIYSFIFHKTLHKETAEDLTSQTFLKALQKLSTFDPQKSQFNTWLFTIARNTVFDFFRSHKNTDDIDDVWDLDSGDDLTQNTDKILEQEKLRERMKALTPEQREILTLHFWQDLSYREIGEILGKTEASVKVASSRAVKKLKGSFLLFLLVPFI